MQLPPHGLAVQSPCIGNVADAGVGTGVGPTAATRMLLTSTRTVTSTSIVRIGHSTCYCLSVVQGFAVVNVSGTKSGRKDQRPDCLADPR